MGADHLDNDSLGTPKTIISKVSSSVIWSDDLCDVITLFSSFFCSFQFYSVHSLRNKKNGSSTKSHFENMKNDTEMIFKEYNHTQNES